MWQLSGDRSGATTRTCDKCDIGLRRSQQRGNRSPEFLEARFTAGPVKRTPLPLLSDRLTYRQPALGSIPP